ncbi:hypothetical protein GOBAR_DD33680 [Gossypium barbadense]|nr:hypothetical protein GOBAR_DD33680 [Gossypium barbadense]
MVEDLGFYTTNVVEEVKDDAGIDFKDYKTVQIACINFGKDRFDILRFKVDFRSLSRQDIQILVSFRCPNADKKVVFSAKLLKKRVHLDEGDVKDCHSFFPFSIVINCFVNQVCSSCSLRNSCEKGYLLTNKEDKARTIDVMRVLVAYGFDYVNGSMVRLIEGIIDQVEGTIHVSWVQPRVLGSPQIKSLRDWLDNWMRKLHNAWLSIEAKTPDLVAS